MPGTSVPALPRPLLFRLRHQLTALLGATALLVCLAASAHATTLGFNQPQNLINFDGAFFDAAVGTTGINVTALEVQINTSIPGTGTGDISVYTRSGTAFGFEISSAGWTLRDTVTVVANGIGSLSTVNVADFQLAANQTHGVYVFINPSAGGGGMDARNLGGSNAVFSNADVALTFGTGTITGGLFGPIETAAGGKFGLTGSLSYTLVPEPASAALLGLGLAGLGLQARRRRLG